MTTTERPNSDGVHNTHCCPVHGCKYNDPECPVEAGLLPGVNCEQCGESPTTVRQGLTAETLALADEALELAERTLEVCVEVLEGVKKARQTINKTRVYLTQP